MGGLIDLLCRFVFKSSDAYLVLVISISSKYVSSSVYSFSLPWQPFEVSILIMMCVSWCVSWCVFHDVCFMMCVSWCVSWFQLFLLYFFLPFFFSRYSISAFSWSVSWCVSWCVHDVFLDVFHDVFMMCFLMCSWCVSWCVSWFQLFLLYFFLPFFFLDTRFQYFHDLHAFFHEYSFISSAKCQVQVCENCGSVWVWDRQNMVSIYWLGANIRKFLCAWKKNEPSTNMRKSCVCLSVGQTSCEFDFFFLDAKISQI